MSSEARAARIFRHNRAPALQREAARRRRQTRILLAASLGLLGALFALFYAVLS
jgi:hypothetical protein